MSSQQRQELVIELSQRFPEYGEDFWMGVSGVFAEWYAAQNTFTDMIKRDGKWGRFCPTCERFFVAYRRSISTEAYLLKFLPVLQANGGFMKISDIVESSGYTTEGTTMALFAMFRWHGLIEKGEHDDYRTTPLCRDFLLNRASVPSSVWIMNNERIVPPPDETDGDPVFLKDIKHEPFDVETVLKSAVSAFSLQS